MARIGLKYISSSGNTFPAVNPGKWTLASNFRTDLGQVLTDCGIYEDDWGKVAVFMRYVRTGLFICAARRLEVEDASPLDYEALWMFIPSDVKISSKDMNLSVRELTEIFEHEEAFDNPEAFADALPPIFLRDFDNPFEERREEKEIEEERGETAGEEEEVEDKEISKGEDVGKNISLTDAHKDGTVLVNSHPMNGRRVGYVPYENDEELELIYELGDMPQYENFGLIFITDNPVRVESSLPRIVLPEMVLLRQLKQPVQMQEEVVEIDEEDEVIKSSSEEEGGVSENTDADPLMGESTLSETGGEEDNGSIASEEQTLYYEEREINKEETLSLLPVLYEEKGDIEEKGVKNWSWQSFILGFCTATIIFVIIYLLFGSE